MVFANRIQITGHSLNEKSVIPLYFINKCRKLNLQECLEIHKYTKTPEITLDNHQLDLFYARLFKSIG